MMHLLPLVDSIFATWARASALVKSLKAAKQ